MQTRLMKSNRTTWFFVLFAAFLLVISACEAVPETGGEPLVTATEPVFEEETALTPETGEEPAMEATEPAVEEETPVVPETGTEPSVTVMDQEIEGNTVTIPQVVSDGPGWIVIHRSEGDTFGADIGQTAVEDGVNDNVAVEIDPAQATETLWAMLHTNTDPLEEYEFPGDDTPVQVEGEVVVEPFQVSGLEEMAAPSGETPTTGMEAPSVSVTDQEVMDSTVSIPQVVSEGPGWLVIHADQDGAPGPVIGYSAVEQGMNEEVQVEIDPASATPTLWAMLHIDADPVGEYEFPGSDGPAQANGEVVVEPFAATGLEEAGMGAAEGEAASVSMVDSAFEPAELSIPVGTTVTWTNNGSLPHTATADDGSFDSGTLEPGDTYEMTFDEAGTFPYYCTFHGGPGGQGMAGVITVTEE